MSPAAGYPWYRWAARAARDPRKYLQANLWVHRWPWKPNVGNRGAGLVGKVSGAPVDGDIARSSGQGRIYRDRGESSAAKIHYQSVSATAHGTLSNYSQVRAGYQSNGSRPAVCTERDGLCDARGLPAFRFVTHAFPAVSAATRHGALPVAAPKLRFHPPYECCIWFRSAIRVLTLPPSAAACPDNSRIPQLLSKPPAPPG